MEFEIKTKNKKKKELKNDVMKILKRSKEFEGIKLPIILSKLTAQKLEIIIGNTALDKIDELKQHYGSLQNFIYESRATCQLNKLKLCDLDALSVTDTNKFDALVSNANKLAHPCLSSADIRHIALLIMLRAPTLVVSLQTEAPPKIEEGEYKDDSALLYISTVPITQLPKIFTRKLLKQAATSRVDSQTENKYATEILQEELSDAQKVFVKLHFLSTENLAKITSKRPDTKYLTQSNTKAGYIRYMKKYVAPCFQDDWPTLKEFKKKWRPRKGHLAAQVLISRGYEHFESKNTRYVWREIGHNIGLNTRNVERVTNAEVEKEIKALHKRFGYITQKLVKENNKSLLGYIQKYYSGLNKICEKLNITKARRYQTVDEKWVDSQAELLLYNHLITAEPDWLKSTEIHAEFVLMKESTRYVCDFKINDCLMIEVEMVNSLYRYDNKQQNSYAIKNYQKRLDYQEEGLNVLFLQQEDCFNTDALAKTCQKIQNALNKSSEISTKIIREARTNARKNWSQQSISNEFDKAVKALTKKNLKVIRMKDIFAQADRGFRDAFYKQDETFKQALYAKEHSLVNISLKKNNVLTSNAIDTLLDIIETTRGVLMSDSSLRKYGFVRSKRSHMTVLSKVAGVSLKAIAVALDLEWLEGKAILGAASKKNIQAYDLQSYIAQRTVLTSEQTARIKEFLHSASTSSIPEIKNSFIFVDGELLPQTKELIRCHVANGTLYPMKKCEPTLAEYISKTLGMGNFLRGIGFNIDLGDWQGEPQVWPRLTN